MTILRDTRRYTSWKALGAYLAYLASRMTFIIVLAPLLVMAFMNRFHLHLHLTSLSASIAIQACAIASQVLALWIDDIRRWGIGQVKHVPLLFRVIVLARVTRMNLALSGLWVVLILGTIVALMDLLPTQKYLMMMVLAVSTMASLILLLQVRPPCALFLGESSRKAGSVLCSVSAGLFPHRTVSLLDQLRSGHAVVGVWMPWIDNVRTWSHEHWRSIVEALADRVVVIIVDTHTDSPLVAGEVALLLASPHRLKRAIFVIGNDGECEALLANGVHPEDPGLRVVQAHTVVKLLRWWVACGDKRVLPKWPDDDALSVD